MSRLSVLFLTIAAPALSLVLALLGLETLRHNLLGWFLLVLGIAFPVGVVVFRVLRGQPFWDPSGARKILREEKGDRSFWAVLPGFLAVFFAPPLEWLYLPAVLPRAAWLQVLGLALVLAALALRVWGRTHLRGLYTGHIQVAAGTRLVQSGPYRCIRHPGYAGFLLIALGVGLGYASWTGLACVLVLLLPGLMYRIAAEERLLKEQFGEQYREYARGTKALIPGVW
jgi:protein-S-isoprenylcysteine O-methyltransferase Ste14